MFGTWDRYPGATDRWQRTAIDGMRRTDPLSNFLTNVDQMIYVAGASLAACVFIILFS